MAKKVKMMAIVERRRGKGNFHCFTPEKVKGCSFGAGGASARKVMENAWTSVQEIRRQKAAEGVTLPEIELDFRLDVGSFFDYYPIDITAFARYIGMNASVLRQYVTGLRQPKEDTIRRIREGIDKLSRDLGRNLMIERPAASRAD